MNRTKQVTRVGKLPPPAPRMIPLEVDLIFNDGDREIGRIKMTCSFPIPPAGQQVNLELPLHARQIHKAIESQLSPAQGKVWTPGQPIKF